MCNENTVYIERKNTSFFYTKVNCTFFFSTLRWSVAVPLLILISNRAFLAEFGLWMTSLGIHFNAIWQFRMPSWCLPILWWILCWTIFRDFVAKKYGIPSNIPKGIRWHSKICSFWAKDDPKLAILIFVLLVCVAFMVDGGDNSAKPQAGGGAHEILHVAIPTQHFLIIWLALSREWGKVHPHHNHVRLHSFIPY